MERFFIHLLSFVFSRIHLPGMYRLVSMVYGYRVTKFQKGVWLTKKYLNKRYNLRIHLYSKDLIDHKILFTGAYEPQTNWVLINNIKAGSVVVEAGANSGTETLLISRLVGEGGSVFAFEPVPHVLKKLKDNLSLNSIANVQVVPMALGETDGNISFYIQSPDHPNQGMGSKNTVDSGLEKIDVQQKKIDTLHAEGVFNKLDFLKMDVQGAELDILKGALKTIEKYKPGIFLEAADGWSNVTRIFDHLESLDYEVFLITNEYRLDRMERNNLKAGNWYARAIEINHETTHSKP
ncbi:MAG TPA: FkbM family methyltransferase [Ohtaekwangia sp.]